MTSTVKIEHSAASLEAVLAETGLGASSGIEFLMSRVFDVLCCAVSAAVRFAPALRLLACLLALFVNALLAASRLVSESVWRALCSIHRMRLLPTALAVGR